SAQPSSSVRTGPSVKGCSSTSRQRPHPYRASPPSPVVEGEAHSHKNANDCIDTPRAAKLGSRSALGEAPQTNWTPWEEPIMNRILAAGISLAVLSAAVPALAQNMPDPANVSGKIVNYVHFTNY